MTSIKMTSVVITAKAEDVRDYNIAMSTLSEAFEPIATKLGGVRGMTQGADPSKPTLTFAFMSEASTASFEAEANRVAAERTWYGARKIPAMNMVRG